MHLEVKVALNFIVSYLYNKLPRRRADLFGEELERILVSRFEGHWYPESPLRGSGFRCLHLGAPSDPVVELAARRSGLDTEEVCANVPAELSVWIDPYEVSYQIGEKGAVKVLYLEDPPGLGGEGDGAEGSNGEGKGDCVVEEAKSMVFNPEAQVFVPVGGQASPVLMSSRSSSPTPLSGPSCPGLFGYPSCSSPSDPTALSSSSNTSSPSPPMVGLSYLPAQQQQQQQQQSSVLPSPRLPIQPITFTTASFAATKFGSTKMKKFGGAGSAAVVVTAGVSPAPQRLLSHSPTTASSSSSPPELLKHKPLSLSLHSLAGPLPSQLSPNAKEFVYPGSQVTLYFDADAPAMPLHAGPFQPSHPVNSHPTFGPFSSPSPPAQGVGIVGGTSGISYMEKPPFVDGLGSYNLQYPSQSFQPVVLAN